MGYSAIPSDVSAPDTAVDRLAFYVRNSTGGVDPMKASVRDVVAS